MVLARAEPVHGAAEPVRGAAETVRRAQNIAPRITSDLETSSRLEMTLWTKTLAVVLVACQLTLVTPQTSQNLDGGAECSLAPTADASWPWTESDVSPPDVNSDLLHYLGDRALLHAYSATADDVIDGSAQYKASLAQVSDWWPLLDDVEFPAGNDHVWRPESTLHNPIQADPRPETHLVDESHPATNQLSWLSPTLASSDLSYGIRPPWSTVDGAFTSNGNMLSPPISMPMLTNSHADEEILTRFNSNEYLPTYIDLSVDPWHDEHGFWSTSPAGNVVYSFGNDVLGVSSVLSDMDLPSFINLGGQFPLPSAHADEQFLSHLNPNDCPPTDVHLPVDPWYGEHGLWSTPPAGNVVSSIGNDVPGVSSVLSDVDLLSFINSDGHFPNAFHSPTSSIQIALQSQIATQIPPDTFLSTWPAHAIGDIPIDTHSIDTSRIVSLSHAAARISDDADCCPLSSLALQKPQFPDNGHWMETGPSYVLSAAECIASQSMQRSQNQVAADQYAYNMFIPAALIPTQIREGDYGTFSRIISEPPSLESLAASSHDRCTAVPFPPEPVRAQGTTEESVNMSGLQLQQGLPKPHGRRPRRPSKKCEHGRHQHNCKICSPHRFCEAHGRRKWDCTICGGPGTCVHGRLTYSCGVCGGKGICPHDRRRDRCRECRGGSFCKHDKYKYECRACGGKGLCVHQRRKDRCGQCRRAAELAMA